ncbi:hypothetical protein D5H78_00110 [Vallicoccus soli]|uniref:DUF4386 family protein n=1 Tax=Vallicoccus soli TaxID=2339232 RepID=A0A3A3Z4D3_9ACTN|nr:hypothetical protein D5H78_00110 [Vallicoccus soli]
MPAARGAAARGDRTGRGARTGRGWAVAGLAAGALGGAGIAASMGVDAVYDPEIQGDAAAIAERLGEQVPAILVFHVATMVSALLLLVFAAGLRRRLAAQAPADGLLPQVASYGLLLVSVAGLMGTALTTEMAFALASDDDVIVPEVAVWFGHWTGTVPWLWVGAGVAALCVAVAALRHGAAPRWLGWTSAVLGGLTVLLGVSPLQYLAGMLGPVWVLVASLAFLAGDRRA